MKKNIKDNLFRIVILVIIIFILFNFQNNEKNNEIIFADAGWDSIQFHNQVAGLIADIVFGYDVKEVPGSSAILHEGLIYNEIDINMEMWTDNLATYYQDLKENRFKEISINFDDNKQGFYVPKYVIYGDKDRGIEPMAPDLEYVEDLKHYHELFKDEEKENIGRIYGSIPGWEADEILYKKFKHYKLDKNYRYFRPGSETALSTAFSSAYEKGEPVVGYYWEPTWLMGLYDFVLLKDHPFDENIYKEGKTEMPSVKVTVGASNNFFKNNKEFIKFLKNYETSSDLTSSALAHMQDTGDDARQTAIWFLKKNDYLLDKWLNKNQADKMRDFLNTQGGTNNNG